MIQRIQSIYLLLASILLGLVYIFPFANGKGSEHIYMADGKFMANDHIALLIALGIAIGISLLDIFLFRNRPLQIKAAYVGVLLIVAIPVIAFLLYYAEAQMFSLDTLSVDVGLFLFLPAFVFMILAIRGIRKDQKIVRSMDRLR